MEAMNFEPQGSAVSLQPLFMTKIENDRGPRLSEQMYRPGVLEGNWLEDSVKGLPTVKDEWATLSETSYRPYKTEMLIRPKFEAWQQRIRTQGIGPRIMIDHHGTQYHNNWTTAHDLSFKILPKGLSGPRLREFNASNKEWIPAQDYTQIYGNLTEYGLTDFMKQKWAIENRPIDIWRTKYQDDFPKYENASSIRHLKPKASLNEPDLRHLGINLLASCESCPIALKTTNPQPYRTVLEHSLNRGNISREGKATGECSTN